MNNDSKYWWEKKDTHEAVFETVAHLELKQAAKIDANKRNIRLYGNSDLIGFRNGDYSNLKTISKLTLNVIQSAIDTATARIAKTLPRPMFLTEDGDFSTIRKAESLEQYVNGCFYKNDLYDTGQRIFTDAAVIGDGFVKFRIEDGEVKTERVFGHEIIVDEDECIYGEDSQRTIHQSKYVSKAVLKAKYPNQKQAIDGCLTGGDDFTSSSMDTDLVRVIESWKMPDGKDDKGKHCICVEKATLFKEDYNKDYLPFEKWGWSPRLMGYWSQSIADQLVGIQVEINRILKNIQTCIYLGAIPKVFVEDGSKVVSAHLNNQIGGIVKYRGTMPKEGQLMRVPQELFTMLNYLYEKAFQIIGLSTMSAQSEKPAGLNSGKAIRTFHDIESERFSVISQRWERFYMNCSKKIIKMSKDAAKDNSDLKVKVIDKKRVKVIKWKDVDMDEDSYVMKVYPTNLLATDPSGRLQDVKELMETGLIDPQTASSLLEFPDVENAMSVKNSIVDDIRATIEDIVEHGEYNQPEPFQNLSWAIPYMQSAYLKYKRSNIGIDKLELFVRWITDALAIVNPPAPPEETDLMEQENEAIAQDNSTDPQESFDEIEEMMDIGEQEVAQQVI